MGLRLIAVLGLVAFALTHAALANLSILKTGKARARRFSTVEAICERSHASPATSSGSSRSWWSTKARSSQCLTAARCSARRSRPKSPS